MKKTDPGIIALRHEIHRRPSLSGREEETASLLADFLRTCRPDRLYTGIGGEGILACFRGKEPGPARMFRCEMDALPIREENPVPYRSLYPGIGHLCGHDGHMAILCGVARELGRPQPAEGPGIPGSPEPLLRKGEVWLLFQPAEEIGAGALRMEKILEDRNLRFRYSFALHNLPGYPLHTVVLYPGTYAYASTGMEIALTGHTSHAAEPHLALNPTGPLLQLAKYLERYDTEATLATIVQISIGEEAYGTTPGHGVLRLTLRADTDEKLEKIRKEIEAEAERLVQAPGISGQNPEREAGSASGTPSERYTLRITYTDAFPATVNHPEANRIVEEAARALRLPLVQAPHPQKGSDDFAFFARRGPAAFFDLGCGEEHPPLHHPRFDFDDRLIPDGISLILELIRRSGE